MVEWLKDKVNGEYRPTLYPGEPSDGWELPAEISGEMHRLNSIIEGKYSREFLKVCAFYNKMFPSLKSSDWTNAAYNVPQFTMADQEHTDTGSGMSLNYLKQIIDQVTSRLGTIDFVPMLISEDQSYEYVVYKDEVERVLRMFIRNDDFNRSCTEAFHNAAVLGYSHAFMDPWTGKLVKAADYEVGVFASQFNRRRVRQMLYRDYSFPAVEAVRYLADCDAETQEEMLGRLSGRSSVDLKMYFDCVEKKAYVTIDSRTLPPRDYPFDRVLMETFQWDVGFARQHGTSLFDLLYPLQREMNRIAAKKIQLIRLYKGAVPVFNSDVDIAMKAITNGSGECLYVDSARPVDSLVTVINPTPLDPQLDAEIQSLKGTMYELAGIQNASFDMENMRSAAAVVAMDQTRDTVFQAQLAGLAQFIKGCLKLYVDFFAEFPQYTTDRAEVDWRAMSGLMDRSYVNLQPVHLNDPLSDEQQAKQQAVDYSRLAMARVTLSVIKGECRWEDLPYYVDPNEVTVAVAAVLIKFEALGIEVPDCVHVFLIKAFIDAVARGDAALTPEGVV